MSLLECYRRSFSNHTAIHNPDSSKLVNEDKVVNGVAVNDYSFKTVNYADDPRQSLRYQDLCLGNLQRLGVTDKLKPVMLQRNDVDEVINSINAQYEAASSQVPSEAN